MSALGREALHGRLPAAGPHCRRGRHPRAARVAAAAAHRERELEPRFYSQEELQSGFPWPAELHQQQAASQRQAQPLGVDGSPEPDARSAPQPLQPEHQPPEKWRMHPPSHDAARPWALAPGGPAFGGVSRAHTCAAATVVLEPESQPCAAAAPPETLTPQHQQPPLANPEPSAAPLTAAAGAPAEARNHDHSDGDWLQRTRLLVGDDGLARLAATHVLLVGLGGVGSYAAEFLVRAGVGALTIVDGARARASVLARECAWGGAGKRVGVGVHWVARPQAALASLAGVRRLRPHPSPLPVTRGTLCPKTPALRLSRRRLRRHDQPQPPAAGAALHGRAAKSRGGRGAAAGHQPGRPAHGAAGARGCVRGGGGGAAAAAAPGGALPAARGRAPGLCLFRSWRRPPPGATEQRFSRSPERSHT